MTTNRENHTATLLLDGSVLIVGGITNADTGGAILSSAERYNPASGAWTAAGVMANPRNLHTATLLPNGKVLVAGGGGVTSLLSSVELYDPATGSWTLTNSMKSARGVHSATLLPSGKVLVVGGASGTRGANSIPGADLYDPATGKWTVTGAPHTPRGFGHTATLLPNGKVLVVAGGNGSSVTSSAELYNPTNGTWTTTGSLTTAPRHSHTATLLPNGKVLIAGGLNQIDSLLSSAETYDPVTGVWTTTGSMNTRREWHTATLLPNAWVLIAGGTGVGNGSPAIASAELYVSGPTVTTGAATDITPTSATLNGTVNPNGLTRTAQFEYGLTTAYGSAVSVTLSPNNGSTAQAVSATLCGLQPGVTYYCRLTASNSDGPAIGSGLPLPLPPLAFTCTTNNGTITITGYNGPGGAVTIPSTINCLPVTTIGARVFENNNSLTSVTISSSVTSIPEMAFAYCYSLTNVTIPDSVTDIGDGAFDWCTSLASVTIPDSITNIGDGAFSECTSLTAITVDVLNPAYSSAAGVLFNKSQTLLIQYPAGKAGGYTIPNSVTSIGDWAFSACASLTNITIPNSVTNFGGGAFGGCTGLTNVTVPDSVTNIGDWAFSECTNLTAITVDVLNPAYSSVGGVLFNKSQTLLIQYPAGKAGGYTIPNSVTSIRDYAFSDCTGLDSITIPAGVTNIWGFFDCTSLTAITVDVLNPVYSSVGGVLFDRSQTTLIGCPRGKAGGYTIPDGVTGIGDNAFANCTRLTSVRIPDSVASIGWWAFFNCTSLTRVYFEGNAPTTVGLYVFDVGGGPPCCHPIGNETIYYHGGTVGWDTSFAGCPKAQWYLPTPVILHINASFGVQSNGFGFIISWATNTPVLVEACTNLASPLWQPVATNTLTDGWAYFSDPQWTNFHSRFYRLRSP